METHSVRSRGRKFRGVAFHFAIFFAIALCIGCGPIGPFSGGHLSGDEAGWPQDWNSISDVTEIQLETGPGDPHSVNLWIVVVDLEAYLATSLLMGPDVPEEREWVRNVEADPNVRIRIDGIVYPARLETVVDSELMVRLLEAFQSKYPNMDELRGSAARFYKVARPAAAPKK